MDLRNSTVVVALGGNALIRPGQKGTIDEQIQNAYLMAKSIQVMTQYTDKIVITHGNGPQVGATLIRYQSAANYVPPLTIYSAVAETQGLMGFLLQQAISALTKRHTVSLITQVVVDKNDPAFKNPTKPIGPFYSKDEAEKLKREYGWEIVHEVGRGWRRVVPSPIPLKIVEVKAIKSLIEKGVLVITVGGGGIPVIEENGKLKGIDAVIDKDRASAVLANELNADYFIILTEVPEVYKNFSKENQEPIRNTSIDELEKLVKEGHFGRGNMLPKIESSIRFIKQGGKGALITSPEYIEKALNGESGTYIHF